MSLRLSLCSPRSLCWLCLAATAGAAAQQIAPMATLPTADALINGQVQISGGQAALLSNVDVTVYDRSTPVTLGRGGQLLACSTSEFHLLRSSPSQSLIFGLDRGALELRTATQGGDMVITPDLKFAPVTTGRYDLRIRVTREGDTCVENDGPEAPVLNATDAFSSASYRVLPGQHLLFIKGDLHQVVDHERTPCGCPAASTVLAGRPGQTGAAQAAASSHPFPEAQSQGLAPTPLAANAAPEGVASSQASATLAYGENATPPSGVGAPSPGPATPAAEAKPDGPGFGSAVKRFFHRLFHWGGG